MVHTLPTIEGEQALCSRANFGNIGLTEGLKESNRVMRCNDCFNVSVRLKITQPQKTPTSWLFLTLYLSFLHINASFPHVWLPGNPAFIKKLCGQAAF